MPCKDPNCLVLEKDGGCVEGHHYKDNDYKNCPNWIEESEESEKENNQTDKINEGRLLNWTGNSFGWLDLKLVSQRGNPFTIGIVGSPDAGKTTFLAMFYRLLFNGYKLDGFDFSGSYSLIGWENISNYLTFNKTDPPKFPPHTSYKDGRNAGLLHLALKKINNY